MIEFPIMDPLLARKMEILVNLARIDIILGEKKIKVVQRQQQKAIAHMTQVVTKSVDKYAPAYRIDPEFGWDLNSELPLSMAGIADTVHALSCTRTGSDGRGSSVTLWRR